MKTEHMLGLGLLAAGALYLFSKKNSAPAQEGAAFAPEDRRAYDAQWRVYLASQRIPYHPPGR